MLDLAPATSAVGALLPQITDDQLAGPTPCPAYTLGDLLDHVQGLTYAFTLAARKEALTGAGPSGDASRLPADWRTGIPAGLDGLAEAWRDPAAWQGMTAAGGVDLPGPIAGIVALTEVVVHGWDVAAASGQPYDVDPELLDAVYAHTAEIAAAGPSEGLFGPAVAIPADAPKLDRMLALTGRDPAWKP